MDIFERSNREHETLEGDGSGACENRSQLFSGLRDELMTHLLAEQEIFYNALLERLDDPDLLLEAFEEHTVVEGLLDEVEMHGLRNPRFGAREAHQKGNCLSKERF